MLELDISFGEFFMLAVFVLLIVGLDQKVQEHDSDEFLRRFLGYETEDWLKFDPGSKYEEDILRRDLRLIAKEIEEDVRMGGETFATRKRREKLHRARKLLDERYDRRQPVSFRG